MTNRGRFVWEELMTTDLVSAATFYSKVAGIKTESAPSDPPYTLLVASASRMGGLKTVGANATAMGASPMWLSYVGTPNVEETVRQAETLGGKIIVPPGTMGDGGRFAVLQDPQGAKFAVYASPRPYQAPAAVPLGGTSWHELVTSDYVGAFSFYQSLFGWHVVQDMDMGPGMGTYRMWAAEGSTDMLGGMYTKPAQQPGPPAWLPYIKVANVKAATATAKKLGAQITHGPAQVPGGGWITMGTDPQGVMFAVHSTPSATKATKATKKATKSSKKKKTTPKKKSAPARKKAKPARKSKARPKAKRKAGSKK